MKRELAEERELAKEQLKHMKLEKRPMFRKKLHEKQFRFNEEVNSKFEVDKRALLETSPAVEKAKSDVEEGEKLLWERQRLADRSEHGWVTVKEYKDDELAEDSDDEKRFVKAEAQAGRKLKQKLMKGKVKKPPYYTMANASSSESTNYDQATNVRASQALSQPGLSKIGPCFGCGFMGHFNKQCPVLQTQLQGSTNSR